MSNFKRFDKRGKVLKFYSNSIPDDIPSYVKSYFKTENERKLYIATVDNKYICYIIQDESTKEIWSFTAGNHRLNNELQIKEKIENELKEQFKEELCAKL